MTDAKLVSTSFPFTFVDHPSNHHHPPGSNPEPAPTRLDTYVDRDATRSGTTHASDTLTGATSQDVHRGIGQPLGGQTSHEEHTNGMHGRKRDAQGVSQFGPPGDREQVLGREERDSQKFGDRVA